MNQCKKVRGLLCNRLSIYCTSPLIFWVFLFFLLSCKLKWVSPLSYYIWLLHPSCKRNFYFNGYCNWRKLNEPLRSHLSLRRDNHLCTFHSNFGHWSILLVLISPTEWEHHHLVSSEESLNSGVRWWCMSWGYVNSLVVGTFFILSICCYLLLTLSTASKGGEK